jgi:phosphate:Na+ symporter
MPIMTALTPVLTGLGLFFCGARFIATNLALLAGPSARRLFRKAVGSRWTAALCGVLAGLLTQSTNAVALITVSFARTGIVDGRRAALAPTWSHVGASALVILVALNTDAAAAYLLAVAGAMLYFDLKLTERVRHAIMAGLGAGMLLLGLELLKLASGPVRAALADQGLLPHGHALVATILLGAGLAVVTQSSTVASAIAVALVRVGLFDLDAALLLLAGANGGSALNYAFLARRGETTGRHILYFQAAQKVLGTIALIGPLLFARNAFDATVLALPVDTAGRLAWTFLVVQLSGSLACTLLAGPLWRWLDRIAPPAREETLAKPAFLVEEALADPDLALELAEREGLRLMQRLPLMLDQVRADGDRAAPSPAVLRDAAAAVGAELRRYLADLLDRQPEHAAIVRVMRLQQVLANTLSLHDGLADFVGASRSAHAAEGARATLGRVTESLHLLMTMLAEGAETDDPEDLQTSLALFGQRDQLMDDLRRRLLANDPTASARVQEALFQTTILFERMLWLGRDTLQILLRARATGQPPAPEIEVAA